MDLQNYNIKNDDYSELSLRDLLDARDQYHYQLMQHPNVVATAVGRYLIRNGDSWPSEHDKKIKGNYKRTLENSSIRPYSWPAILVFVEKWVDESKFSTKGDYLPKEIIPKALYLRDGRKVPVCVIEAPKVSVNTPSDKSPNYPLNNIGSGHPVFMDVQQIQHKATVACLVTDGHKVYALTNRHVTGDAGEVIYSSLGGKMIRIGTSSAKQLTRSPFSEIYPSLSGQQAFVNLDVGLIDIDDVNHWTAKMADGTVMGPLADFSGDSISLNILGCHVIGNGATSGLMEGQIHALFYRYKSQGGFEYVSDILIGPLTIGKVERRNKKNLKHSTFATHPGDSGTLWLLVPKNNEHGKNTDSDDSTPYLPLALQWGEQTLSSGNSQNGQSYVLATLLGRVCELLNVDLIRDWNIDQPNTWGAVGHFCIASRGSVGLSDRVPNLKKLMDSNLELITHNDDELLSDEFKGMGDASFVQLADVPDFYWKHGKQGHSRPLEGPNHFADMDQPRPNDGVTLLDLCKDNNNVDPNAWNEFYNSVTDLLTGEQISQEHRGLLPFRVWQIFDEMVKFAQTGDSLRFVCAAGVLTHYVGDACQPLHISYLHDGNPLQATMTSRGPSPLGVGVHSAYEDAMVSLMRKEILDGLDKIKTIETKELLQNGFQAAVATVNLMNDTFNEIPPNQILQAFIHHDRKNGSRGADMKNQFGDATVSVMKSGTRLISLLWESAWTMGDGENKIKSLKAFNPSDAMDVCADETFLPSVSIAKIGDYLKKPDA